MTAKRRYRLLCPIARALDAVGDRWALLILRDLHAGPARFQELETGLGIATNLLSTRLSELTDAGLVERETPDGRSAYRLTALGLQTDRLLWELARFGSLLDPEPDPREPGNLRTIALPLRFALEAATHRPTITVHLRVDTDLFTIVSTPTDLQVLYGDDTPDPDLVIRTDYEAFLATGEGRMPFEQFAEHHLDVVAGADRLPDFLALMAASAAV